MCLRSAVIHEHERGFAFLEGEFREMLRPGRHFILDPSGRVRVDVRSVRDVRLEHPQLDAIVRSGALGGEAEVVALRDHERAVVWVDRRVEAVLGPGLYALWKVAHEVHVDVVDSQILREERLASVR